MGFSLKSVFRAPKKIFKAAKKVVKSPLFPVIAGIAGPAMLAKYGASGALGSGVFQTGNALGSMGARAALSNAIAQAASGEASGNSDKSTRRWCGDACTPRYVFFWWHSDYRSWPWPFIYVYSFK